MQSSWSFVNAGLVGDQITCNSLPLSNAGECSLDRVEPGCPPISKNLPCEPFRIPAGPHSNILTRTTKLFR